MKIAASTIFILTSLMVTAPSTAQSQSDLKALVEQAQKSSEQQVIDENAKNMSEDYLKELKIEKLTEETASPGNLYVEQTAFPDNIFDLSQSLKTQTDWLVKRAAKGKRARAVYDPESSYREDVAALGQQASQAAQSVHAEDPDMAGIYAEVSRDLLSAIMTPVEADDIKGQSIWLREVAASVDQISVLRKKPAR